MTVVSENKTFRFLSESASSSDISGSGSTAQGTLGADSSTTIEGSTVHFIRYVPSLTESSVVFSLHELLGESQQSHTHTHSRGQDPGSEVIRPNGSGPGTGSASKSGSSSGSGALEMHRRYFYILAYS